MKTGLWKVLHFYNQQELSIFKLKLPVIEEPCSTGVAHKKIHFKRILRY